MESLSAQRTQRVGALPSSGYVRISGLIAPIGPLPLSKSTLWAKVKSGQFPAPIKLFDRVTCWRVEDVQAFINAANDKDAV